MIEPLNEAQQHWVEATFATLHTEDKVAQLLIPTLGAYDYRREAVDAFLGERTLGGIFVGIADQDQHRDEIARLRARCSIPMVVASDLMALPAWDDTTNACGVYCPASISHKLVTGLLREELGFQGLMTMPSAGF